MLTFDISTMAGKKYEHHFNLTSINYKVFVNGVKIKCQSLLAHSFVKCKMKRKKYLIMFEILFHASSNWWIYDKSFMAKILFMYLSKMHFSKLQLKFFFEVCGFSPISREPTGISLIPKQVLKGHRCAHFHTISPFLCFLAFSKASNSNHPV